MGGLRTRGRRKSHTADSRQAATLNWVVRVGVVATVLWPDDVDARLNFVKRCIALCKDQAPLLEEE